MTTAPCPGRQPATVEVGEWNSKEHAKYAVTATDLEWHLAPAHPHLFCGGCGSEAEQCHPGRCCTDAEDRLGFSDGVCDLCPDRYATGQLVAP